MVGWKILMLVAGTTAAAASTSVPQRVDLAKAAQSWRAINRQPAVIDSGGRTILRLGEAAGAGMLWTPDIDFSDGEIELDVRGRDVFQKSFVGIAFHARSDTAFDAVYLRPFNFHSPDPTRRTHAIQYTSYPDFPWERLRADSTGRYEKPAEPAPDPNAWVHLRFVLRGSDLQVFVDRAAGPALHVHTLGGRTHGGVGLWVGDLSPGDFANLVVTPAS